jgi:hypothetical protein
MTTTESSGDFSPQGSSGGALSYEAAIAQTQSLLDQLEHQQLSDAEWGRAVAELVATEAGARGFFVTYLTDDHPLADSPSQALLAALETAPDIVSELLIKNIAMSTAMAIAHRRNQDEALAQGSDRVQSRTAHLLKVLTIPQIETKRSQLHESALSGEGVYQSFLQRWNYDAEQRQAIATVLTQL